MVRLEKPSFSLYYCSTEVSGVRRARDGNETHSETVGAGGKVTSRWLSVSLALSLLLIPAGRNRAEMLRGPGLSEQALLARLVSGEAGGESYEAQVAVAAVALNRLRGEGYPKTLAGVIFQPGAFAAVGRGTFYRPICATCWQAAADALAGFDPTGGALYCFNPAAVQHPFFWRRPVARQIGRLVFAR